METALKPCVGVTSASGLPVAQQHSRLVFPAPSRPRTRTWVPADWNAHKNRNIIMRVADHPLKYRMDFSKQFQNKGQIGMYSNSEFMQK